jgi:LacI family transcriptional regulator
MLACKAAGLKIPQDIGIVGFSNWQFCTMLDPTLSSVSQPGIKIGQKATEMLIDLIEKKIDINSIKEPFVLETELLIRNSSLKNPKK